MGIGRKKGSGGGGAALNFKVVPGLTQPGTASENTIWVKTERIGAWYFSATQPEGLQEWDVWFLTGIESDFAFNALRKNAVQVYPLLAKQYVNNALVDVTAISYQNGEWVDWISDVYLFNNGDKCTNVTGGWVAENYHSGYPAAGGSVVFNSDHMVINAVPNGSISAITSNQIDFSGYSKLRILAKTTHGGYSVVINSKFPVSDFMSTRDITISKTAKENAYVDLSTLKGNYRIAITSVSGGVPLYIYEVELQK